MAELRTIPTDQIDVSPSNPRRTFRPDALQTLASSIEDHGVLQPILVRQLADSERFEIVAGERRWRACCLAQQSEIPAIIVQMDEPIFREVQLIENLERADLNVIEEGLALKSMQELFGYSQVALAERMKRSPQYIRQRLDLLKLGQTIQEFVAEGLLPVSVALELLNLDDPEAQLELASIARVERWTAKEASTKVEMYKRALRIRASQIGKKFSLEQKSQALAREGAVVTPATLNPALHHRVWDLRFHKCGECELKGKFLRADGQVEDVCVIPGCYSELLTLHKETSRARGHNRELERLGALEQVLNSEEVSTAHLHYVLWVVLQLMGPEADGWRAESRLAGYAHSGLSAIADWDMVEAMADEQTLLNILRLTVAHIAATAATALPMGLKRSLAENFGISTELFSEVERATP